MSPETETKIAFLLEFKKDIQAHFNGANDPNLRTRISRGMRRAKEIIGEAGAMKLVTLTPPPAIGGLIVRGADPFGYIFEDYYGMSMIPGICDMIEEAIGAMEDPDYETRLQARKQTREAGVKGAAQANASIRDAELPEKVTISWLVTHVPISFWVWLIGIIAAAFTAGYKVANLVTR